MACRSTIMQAFLVCAVALQFVAGAHGLRGFAGQRAAGLPAVSSRGLKDAGDYEYGYGDDGVTFTFTLTLPNADVDDIVETDLCMVVTETLEEVLGSSEGFGCEVEVTPVSRRALRGSGITVTITITVSGASTLEELVGFAKSLVDTFVEKFTAYAAKMDIDISGMSIMLLFVTAAGEVGQYPPPATTPPGNYGGYH